MEWPYSKWPQSEPRRGTKRRLIPVSRRPCLNRLLQKLPRNRTCPECSCRHLSGRVMPQTARRRPQNISANSLFRLLIGRRFDQPFGDAVGLVFSFLVPFTAFTSTSLAVIV